VLAQVCGNPSDETSPRSGKTSFPRGWYSQRHASFHGALATFPRMPLIETRMLAPLQVAHAGSSSRLGLWLPGDLAPTSYPADYLAPAHAWFFNPDSSWMTLFMFFADGSVSSVVSSDMRRELRQSSSVSRACRWRSCSPVGWPSCLIMHLVGQQVHWGLLAAPMPCGPGWRGHSSPAWST
jgi:hypothetical protein